MRREALSAGRIVWSVLRGVWGGECIAWGVERGARGAGRRARRSCQVKKNMSDLLK